MLARCVFILCVCVSSDAPDCPTASVHYYLLATACHLSTRVTTRRAPPLSLSSATLPICLLTRGHSPLLIRALLTIFRGLLCGIFPKMITR